jgi:hypothetical protein
MPAGPRLMRCLVLGRAGDDVGTRPGALPATTKAVMSG